MCYRYGLLVALVMSCSGAFAAEQERVVARVGDQAITAADVDRELRQAVRELPQDADTIARLKAAMLQECVSRELALQWLLQQKLAASEADVEQAISRSRKAAATTKRDWQQQLAESGHTEVSYRRETLWRLSWVRYLETQTTDDKLQRYFAKHKTDFDDTQVRVAHILWKVETADDAAVWEQAKLKAAAVRDEIATGKLTFAAAATKYSQAPTAKEGGDLGFIGRRRPMPEAFSAAAFALAPGELSAPLESTAGVHLIQVTEITPGTRAWTESRDELKAAVTRYVFEWIGNKQRERVAVIMP